MTPLQVEIRRVHTAIERQCDRVDARWPFEPGEGCCQTCVYSNDYAFVDACDKIERVEKWLAILQEKQKKRLAKAAAAVQGLTG